MEEGSVMKQNTKAEKKRNALKDEDVRNVNGGQFQRNTAELSGGSLNIEKDPFSSPQRNEKEPSGK